MSSNQTRSTATVDAAPATPDVVHTAISALLAQSGDDRINALSEVRRTVVKALKSGEDRDAWIMQAREVCALMVPAREEADSLKAAARQAEDWARAVETFTHDVVRALVAVKYPGGQRGIAAALDISQSLVSNYVTRDKVREAARKGGVTLSQAEVKRVQRATAKDRTEAIKSLEAGTVPALATEGKDDGVTVDTLAGHVRRARATMKHLTVTAADMEALGKVLAEVERLAADIRSHTRPAAVAS